MERKSPTISATELNVGTIKKGNDGNQWIINETSNGTHRWIKISPKITDKILARLTSRLSWKVTTKKFKDIQIFTDNDDNPFRSITDAEFKMPVMYGVNKVYIGGGWNEKEFGCVGAKIRFITVGKQNQYTSFKQLLTKMFEAYQTELKQQEIDDLIARTFREKDKKQTLADYKKGKLTFSDWLEPHVFFEGPMYKNTKPNKYQNPNLKGMYCFGYGS